MRRAAMLLLVLAILWAIPGVRGNVSAAVLPALEKLGPAGDVVAKPVRRTVARMRVTSIVRTIAADYNEGRPLPEERGFDTWLRTRLPDNSPVDPWGNGYWFSRTRSTLLVGSSGPDGRRGTADDVTHSIPY